MFLSYSRAPGGLRRALVLLTGAALAGTLAVAGPAPTARGEVGTPTGSAPTGTIADPVAKIKPGLQRKLDDRGRADFWIRLDGDADLTAAAQLTDWDDRGEAVVSALKKSAQRNQASVVARLKTAGATYQTFWATDAVYVENGSATLAEQVAAEPDVDALFPSRTYHPVEPVSEQDAMATAAAVEWGVSNINADDVWATGDTGAGIVIANIDSGVDYQHPALKSQYRGTHADGTVTHDYNWLDTNASCSAGPCDGDGHGTHTMGTMVGSDGPDNQIGVAPGATWIAANGCATCSDVDLIEAGQWMLAPTKVDGTAADATKRPHIINNSWGTQIPSNDPFMEDISQAWSASGIFAIWSNGNNGPSCQSAGSPGSRTINYSVGAYDVNNTVGSFSSRGSGQDGGIKPNISAPGVDVRSALPNGQYGLLSGTSMAAPHVAGALALLWSAQPDLIGDIASTTELLNGTAIDTEDAQCGGTPANNNVYGEGRLDALALVESGDRGPVGTLDGTVTDDGDAALADATVHVTGGPADGEVDREITVDDEGHFSTTLPVGDYDVSASAFGYEDDQASVTLTEGTTTTQDFALTALPTATLTGHVTDGSGQGWPLYAEVKVAGAPGGQVHTDPRDGSFSVELPAGASYDLSVTADYPGYERLTQSVSLTEDTSVNLAVPVQQRPCLAPGYHQQQPRIALVTSDPGFEFRDFFGGYGIEYTTFTTSQLDQIQGFDLVVWTSNYTLPDNAAFEDLLARTDAGGTGIVFADFAFGQGNGIAALSAATGNPVALERRNTSGPGTFYEVTREHPVLDGFEVGDRIDHLGGAQTAWFTGYEGDGRQVIAGAGDMTRGVSGPGIGVQQRETNRHVLLSMHARGAGSWVSESEEIFWNSLSWANTSGQEFACVPDEEGALLVGAVTDANTGEGVDGARISVGEASTESAATPADAGLDDGFFWLYSPVAGAQDVTVTANKYVTWTESVTLNGLTPVDIGLAAGQLSVGADSLAATQELGSGTEAQTVTFTNTGTAPVDLRLGERDRGFALQQADGSTTPRRRISTADGARVQRLDVPVAVGSSGRAATADENATPHSEPWIDIADHPTAVMDNAVVRLDGKIYSIGGYSNGHVDEVWVYDPSTLAWSAVASLPEARSQMTAGVIDGRIVATGGWDSTDTPRGDTWIYDPATDVWSVGAVNPQPGSGAAAATVNGQLFAIGGCTTGQCNPMSSSVMAYDPAADEWQQFADYPLAVSFAACGAIDWTVYCSGGIGTEVTAQTYAYDPSADTWTRKADAPAPVWGSADTVANDLLMVVGGVQSGQITNQSFGYDPRTDAWTSLPFANTPRYRGGAACGFYKVGGSVQGYTPDPASEMLPGYDQCDGGSTGVDWLAADRTSFTLEVGESVEVTVTTDAAVDQPGTYDAELAIQESTPYPQAAIPVTMTVTPPRSWGKLAGAVSGTTCDGSATPLAAATLQLESRTSDLTLSTGEDGSFARWFDRRTDRKVTVSAAKAGYSIESTSARIASGRTTTADLELTKTGC